MSNAPQTISDRFEQTVASISPLVLVLIVVAILAVGVTLLFVQTPMVHDSLHDFRHAVGVPCH